MKNISERILVLRYNPMCISFRTTNDLAIDRFKFFLRPSRERVLTVPDSKSTQDTKGL